MNSQLLILGLHRVGYPPPEAKIRGLFISPDLLSFQLSIIQKMGFRFTSLRDALDNPYGKRAVITFDDGYQDNIENALPILQKFNAPATLFVITGDVGKRKVVWKEAGENLPADLLDWNSLRSLVNLGWEIGSHAHAHVHLARYPEFEQRVHISKSIAEIRKNLGIKPVSFAYPYGSFNEITKKSLHEQGIKYAVTTLPTNQKNSFFIEDLLELSRVSLGGRMMHHYAKTCFKMAKAVSICDLLNGFINLSLSSGFIPLRRKSLLSNAFRMPLDKVPDSRS
jgi:peptidoglycan/xylan/chitin deacetylase (PgdA/CDA1 family)